MDPQDRDPHRLAARLQALEEGCGFADRTVEQLSAEIAALNRALAQTQDRLRRLEARLDQFLRASEPEEQGS